MNYSDRDNGALSSNTPHCTPLECGDWTHHDSIDIALRWSADAGSIVFYWHLTGCTIALLIQSLNPLE